MKTLFHLFTLILISGNLFSQTMKEVTSKEAEPLLHKRDLKNSVVIDGRDSAMFASGHIAGAVNIDAFGSDLKKLLKIWLTKQQIFVYCTNSTR